MTRTVAARRDLVHRAQAQIEWATPRREKIES
jgi:hypothetical protein